MALKMKGMLGENGQCRDTIGQAMTDEATVGSPNGSREIYVLTNRSWLLGDGDIFLKLLSSRRGMDRHGES